MEKREIKTYDGKIETYDGKVPNFLPQCKQPVAYYLENDEDFQKALFEYCAAKGVSIGRWEPQYRRGHKSDYELFQREFYWCDRHLDLPEERTPGWYLFQFYDHKDTYWSDNLGQEVTHCVRRVTVDSIEKAGERVKEFLEQFGIGGVELSYVDLLTRLGNDLGSDICMPDDVKAEAETALNRLKELLWSYSV